MSIIYLLLILLLVFTLGLSICAHLSVNHFLEKWGLSWLLGMGWSTMIWFLMYLFLNIPFTLISLFVALGISNLISTILYILRFKSYTFASLWNIKSQITKSWRECSSFVKIISYIILFLCCFIFVQDLFWPVTDWDALALYDFRAKVMVETGTLKDGKELGYFFQYPLFTSMLHATVYLTTLGNAKIWYFILFQAFLAVFYALLRKKTNQEMSIIGTLLMATCPVPFYHSLMAYTNLPYIVYACLGLIYLWHWFDKLETKNLIIGSMLLGLSTWVRISEPFYYIGILVVLIGGVYRIYLKKEIKKTSLMVATGILLIYCTRLPWDYLITQVYGENLNTPLAVFSLIPDWDWSIFFNRIAEVSIYLWQYSVPVFSSYLLIVFILFLSDLKNKQYENLLQIFTIAVTLGLIFLGTFLLSLWLESWNRIGDSVARMSLFLVPLLIYMIASNKSWTLYKKNK